VASDHEGPNPLKKAVQLSPEFKALWARIKPRTTYRVEFETEALVARAVGAIKRMEKIETPKIIVGTGRLDVKRGGIATAAVNVAKEDVSMLSYPVPDILGYLQNETELTRSTLVPQLPQRGRLVLLPGCTRDS
jgi:type III restriction enzyme